MTLSSADFGSQASTLIAQLVSGAVTAASFETQFSTLVQNWGVSNPVLAAQLSGLATNWNLNQDQLSNWTAGTPTGGAANPDGSGTGGPYYPLTSAVGLTRYFKCLAALAGSQSGSVQIATTYTANTDLSATPIIMAPGGSITANGCVVTLPAAFQAPLAGCLIVQNGGSFVFAASPEGGVYPDWWVTGASTDRPAIQAAVNSGVALVNFGPRVYTLDAVSLAGASFQAWQGEPGKTVIRYTVPVTGNGILFNQQQFFSIKGIIFDGNGQMVLPTTGTGAQLIATSTGSYPGLLPLIYFAQCSDYELSDCAGIGFDTCGFLANVATRGKHNHNMVTRATSSPYQNYGIAVLGGVGAVSSNCEVVGNTIVNTDITCNTCYTLIADNDVSGWGFSAGINIAEAASSHTITIRDNKCHDGVPTPDQYGYYGDGIENWAPYTVLAGNRCWNCNGSGIMNGGLNNVVANNICYNNGFFPWDGKTFHGNISGGLLANGDPANGQNSSGTLYIGNKCFDTRPVGQQTQIYGYREDRSDFVGINLVGNDFSGNADQPTDILSPGTTLLVGGTSAVGSNITSGLNADGQVLALRAYASSDPVISFQAASGASTFLNLGASGAQFAVFINAQQGLETPGTWNAAQTIIGSFRIWDDGAGNLRFKGSAPTSATDGAIFVGN